MMQIPANGQDLANHIGSFWNVNGQIQIVLEFDKQLDMDCLKKAVRLSLDSEPILGCYFVEDEHHPYWRRLENINDIDWCTLENVKGNNTNEELLIKVLSEPFSSKEQNLHVKVLRTDKNDIVCIKIHHSCCDGGGVKEYVHLLSSIYNKVFKNNAYTPDINTTGKRDSAKLFKVLGIENPMMAFNPQIAALKPTWAFPFTKAEVKNFNFFICKFDKNQTNIVYSRAKENCVTINDVILTAFYRAMFKIVKPDQSNPMEICVTVDLRKYLTERKSEAICNLSGVVNHRINKKDEEDFNSTLKRVSLSMTELKNNNAVIHSAACMEMLTKMEYKDAAANIKSAWKASVQSEKSTVNLSNIGIIASYPFKFGENIVNHAYIVTPVFKAPSFMLGVSTYNDMLTYTVGYCEPEVAKADIEKFFTHLKNELSSL